HASFGGPLDDVAIRVAEIDRPAEAVVYRSAHFHGAVATLFEHALEHVVVNGECYMQVEAVLLLEVERLVRRLKKGEARTVLHLEERVQRLPALDLQGADQVQPEKCLLPRPPP